MVGLIPDARRKIKLCLTFPLYQSRSFDYRPIKMEDTGKESPLEPLEGMQP